MREPVSDVSGVSAETLIGSDSCESGSSDSGATARTENFSMLLAECSEDWREMGDSGSGEGFLKDGGGVGAVIVVQLLKDSLTKVPY